MTKRKNSGPKIEAKATAKAELVAKATYERRHVTTEVIPADVSRAKAGAWLDLISPFTEWAGLKGDELKLKRAQLRLQREDVLADIVARAGAKLESSQSDLHPIRSKFLVPFLEKASLEDDDSSLIDMWAGLLASAAAGNSSNHVHFVSIMSQLSSRQGQLFGELIHTDSERTLGLGMDRIKGLESHSIEEAVTSVLLEMPPVSPTDFDPACEKIIELMNCVGVEVVYGDVSIGPRANYVEINFDDHVYADELEIDFSILEAVGLIRRVDARVDGVNGYSVSLVYYHLTAMGYYLAKACGLVRDLGDVLSIKFEKEFMIVALDGGRKVAVRLEHFPQLLSASLSVRKNYSVTRISVLWEDLSEEIAIETILQLGSVTHSS